MDQLITEGFGEGLRKFRNYMLQNGSWRLSPFSSPTPNFTSVTQFLFEGFSSFSWQHRFIFFIVFLTLYLLTLSGNAIIVTIIRLDRHLHTPMYFFLSMLSISETCYTMAIIPRMLCGLLSPGQPIAIQSCATQLFFYLTFGINNCFLLTVMGYDRYVAICNPLRYSLIMGRGACVQLASASLGLGLGMAIVQVTSVFGLPMKKENFTVVTEFVFLGFSRFQEHQLTLFVVFLALYLLTLAGNVIIVTIISLDRHLHTPMYFFLSVLSASETVYTLVIVPRMLCSLVGLSKTISLGACATQMFFFITLAINNCFLLTAMGYDRYVAICNPLRYSLIMNKNVCAQLVGGALSIGLLVAIIQISSVFRLPFCGTEVAHYFCDILPVMKLSCADTTVHDIINFVISSLVILVPMGLVFISYVLIISSILRIASAEGRKKAFATCASHLTVVIIHYGCASIAYLKPKSENSRDEDQLISVTYTVITPLLNPMVYSLRNKEVQNALNRAMGKKCLV
ncbi:olfactory receptor 10J1-like [Erinaceus europaeus]|uniref:Olfactory receptor 10J1-like n=1 Tax=Erinaceus europaeus TaxID=9365 RepID=A0ABM3XW71_ERIEU|nr:olfactory receptor 10J1-like [Erinaceus europaeus]